MESGSDRQSSIFGNFVSFSIWRKQDEISVFSAQTVMSDNTHGGDSLQPVVNEPLLPYTAVFLSLWSIYAFYIMWSSGTLTLQDCSIVVACLSTILALFLNRIKALRHPNLYFTILLICICLRDWGNAGRFESWPLILFAVKFNRKPSRSFTTCVAMVLVYLVLRSVEDFFAFGFFTDMGEDRFRVAGLIEAIITRLAVSVYIWRETTLFDSHAVTPREFEDFLVALSAYDINKARLVLGNMSVQDARIRHLMTLVINSLNDIICYVPKCVLPKKSSVRSTDTDWRQMRSRNNPSVATLKSIAHSSMSSQSILDISSIRQTSLPANKRVKGAMAIITIGEEPKLTNTGMVAQFEVFCSVVIAAITVHRGNVERHAPGKLVATWGVWNGSYCTAPQLAVATCMSTTKSYQSKTGKVCSCGVAMGDMIAGNLMAEGIGSPFVVGQPVSMCQALTALARQFSVGVLTDAATRDATQADFRYRAIDVIANVPNIPMSHLVCEVLSALSFNQKNEEWMYVISSKSASEYSAFEDGFTALRAGKLEEAHDHLLAHVIKMPGDNVARRILAAVHIAVNGERIKKEQTQADNPLLDDISFPATTCTSLPCPFSRPCLDRFPTFPGEDTYVSVTSKLL